MRNYIPLDYFSANKTKVYMNKKTCEEEEGSAVAFDPIKIVLKNSKIENNEVVIDDLKVQADKDFKLANQYKEDRRREFEKEGLTFESFIEMIIENDEVAMSKYRRKREAVKAAIPKPK